MSKLLRTTSQLRSWPGRRRIPKISTGFPTFLADDITIKMASPWIEEPWRLVVAGADALIERFTAPINQGSSLRTENDNVVAAGEGVVVEQLSTVSREGRDYVSMVCHIFTVNDGRIRGIRAYRNDVGYPPAESPANGTLQP